MTLIVTYFDWRNAYSASDRLVSLQTHRNTFGGVHDDLSNKTVVLMADDGVAVASYTGHAYVSGVSTDRLIAEILYDEPVPPGTFVANRSRRLRGKIGDHLFRLRNESAKKIKSEYVELSVVGFRDYRKRMFPFNIKFILGSSDNREAKLKPPFPITRGFRTAGAVLSANEFQRAYENSDLSAAPWRTDLIPGFLTTLIRNKSSFDPTVGNEIMMIHVDALNRVVECRFETDTPRTLIDSLTVDGNPQNVAYTPWVVGWNSVTAPSVMRTPSPLTLSDSRWEVRLYGAPPDDGAWSILFMGQPRSPPP